MKNASRVLKEVFRIIPDAWLFGGTLLGAVRENQILTWDRDVDLGYKSELVDSDTIEKFESSGFSLSTKRFDAPNIDRYVPGGNGIICKLIAKKDDVKVEIMCFKQGKPGNRRGRVEDLMYYQQGLSGSVKLFCLPVSVAYPTQQIDFYDFSVNIPVAAEEQLEFVYGPEWRIPRKSWYWTADHFLCRERTTIELGEVDDLGKRSKWAGRRSITKTYGVTDFPDDINTPYFLRTQQ
jgi:hypothetical protein